MKKQIKETDGMSLDAAPSARNFVQSSSEIIADNSVTCKGGNLTLHVGNIDYSVLVEYKKFLSGEEAYFNATDTINQYNLKVSLCANSRNKKLNNWLRNRDTQELIQRLESLMPPRARNKTLVEQRGTGRYKATWLHRELWLHLMYWLDVDHKIAIMQFVETIMAAHELVTQNREILKHDTKVKNEAVQLLERKIKAERPTSKAAQFIYTNIQRGINRAITGKWSKAVREELTAEQILQMDELELEVERFILKNIDSMDAKLLTYRLDTFIDHYFQRSA